MIGNLLKTALSHILKFHIFSFAVSVFVVINSLLKQVLDFSGFVAQSHVHLNPGSLSSFGGLVFKRLLSVRDKYLLRID